MTVGRWSRWRWIGLALAVALVAVLLVYLQPRSADRVPLVREAINEYCVECHDADAQVAALILDAPGILPIEAHPETWEKVVRKLRARVMPPEEPRPDESTYVAIVEALETALDAEAARHPDPGAPSIHRLNRAEYANAIRDLLALDVDSALLLPADDSAYGFDNVADALNLSPALQERYLAAARKISLLAVGGAEGGPVETTYRLRQDLSQHRHIEGMPLGTIGGAVEEHLFPMDGEYVFQTRLFRTNLGMMRGLEHEHVVEYTIDGERVHIATIGGDEVLAQAFETPTQTGDAMEARLRFRARVAAGPHRIGVGFVEFAPRVDSVRLEPYLRSSYDTLDWTGRPHLEMLSITGPFDAAGPGDTPSRRRIFACRPADEAAELPCARQIMTTLLRRAFRRAPTESDLDNALRFYEAGRDNGGFETGVQAGLQYILASPYFVFRVERSPDGAAPGSVHPVGDVELASRLSFFLWSSIPDDDLLDAAFRGELAGTAGRERQVKRMLADPRAAALIENFVGQWLQLRNVASVLPNSEVFPDFDDNLRQSLARETELLFAHVMQEDRGVLELLDADYTFVDERLAEHYGIRGVSGSAFRRVPVATDARRGLLGHGSILALTSHAERTAPTLRGKWILENLLGTPPPAPPPDVPALEASSAEFRTLRERLEQHRANPQCASCHKLMDPLGFALESFDAVGAWRTHDDGKPIDTTGTLADQTPVDGAAALRAAILARPELFVTTMTEKMLVYALGRGLDPRDMPAVRAIVRQAAADDYRFSSIVQGIANSTPFLLRRTVEAR